MPDRVAVSVHDLGIIHHTRNAVRVLDVLGGVQIVHHALNAGGAVQGGVGTFHGLVQIRLGQHDLADHAVIGKLAADRRIGVRILIVRQPDAVSGIGAGGILWLVVQCDGNGVAFRRAQQGPAAVGGAGVRIVILVGQVDDRAVVVPGDGERIGPFALHLPSRAGLGDVRPVAVVAFRGAGLRDDKLALIALGVIEGAVGRAAGGIAAAIGNGITAVLIADNRILVVPAKRDVQLLDRIPLEHRKLGVRRNGLVGLAVDLGNVDLDAPFLIVDGYIGAAIRGHRDLLFAAGAARVGVKAMGNRGLAHRKGNVHQLASRRCDRRIHGRLCFTLQPADRLALGGTGRRVGLFLGRVRPHVPAGRTAGFADRVVQRPAGRGIAAGGVVGIVHDVAAGGHGLRPDRRQAPAAAVNAAAGGRRRDLKHRFVNRLAGDKADLVQAEPIAQIQRPAGRLRASRPGGIILRFGNIRHIRTALLGNFFAHNSDRLPGVSGRRCVDVGIVAVLAAVGGEPVAVAMLCQCLGRSTVGLCSQAVRVVLHDPQLGVVVIAVGGLFCGIV